MPGEAAAIPIADDVVFFPQDEMILVASMVLQP